MGAPTNYLLYGEGVPNLFPSHGLFGLIRGTWLSDGNRIFAIFFTREREIAGQSERDTYIVILRDIAFPRGFLFFYFYILFFYFLVFLRDIAFPRGTLLKTLYEPWTVSPYPDSLCYVLDLIH